VRKGRAALDDCNLTLAQNYARCWRSSISFTGPESVTGSGPAKKLLEDQTTQFLHLLPEVPNQKANHYDEAGQPRKAA